MTRRSKIERLENAEARLRHDRQEAFREICDLAAKHQDGEAFWRVVFANAGMEGPPHLTGGIPVQPEDWEKADAIFAAIPDDVQKRLQLDHKG